MKYWKIFCYDMNFTQQSKYGVYIRIDLVPPIHDIVMESKIWPKVTTYKWKFKNVLF